MLPGVQKPENNGSLVLELKLETYLYTGYLSILALDELVFYKLKGGRYG